MGKEPYEFNALAQYNAEVARGLVHTPEWKAKMANEQERFDWQSRREMIMRHGGDPSSLGPPPPNVRISPAMEGGTFRWRDLLPFAVALLLAVLILVAILLTS